MRRLSATVEDEATAAGQYTSWWFGTRLREAGLLGCMGTVATAGDNALMESFLSVLQRNVLDRHRWTTRQEFRLPIVTSIERTYHRRRRQARLGRLTPIEYQTIRTTPATQAA